MVELSHPNLPASGDYLLTGPDDLGEDLLLPSVAGGSWTVERYSLQAGHDWWAGDLRGNRGCYRFRAFHRGEYCTEVRLQVPGSDQVLPALAALAIGTRCRLSPGEIKERLEEYSGVPRGFESRGSWRGATLIDDEASGLQAVGWALRLAREVYGQRTLRVVYLPYLVGELPDPAEFAEANALIVVDSCSGRQEWTRQLASSLRSSGALVAGCTYLEQAIFELDRCLEPGDVLITLGASEVGTIADAFLRRLSRDRHG